MKALILGARGGISGAVYKCLTSAPSSSIYHSVMALGRHEGFDVRSPQQAESCLLQTAAEHGPFDLIFDATGILESSGGGQPEKALRQIDSAHMSDMFLVNAIGPALVLKHFAKITPKPQKNTTIAQPQNSNNVSLRRRGPVFATLSARVGSIEDNRLGGWISYRASKAALNQIVRTASIELQRTHPTSICVAMHPGTVRTNLSEKYVRGANNKHTLLDAHVSAERMLTVVMGLEPADTGKFFAYDGSEIPW